MSADEYWNGDVWLVHDYLKAERYRQERSDYDAWLQGYYVQNALLSTVGNLFLSKGKQPYEYPAIPLAQQAKEEEKAETKRREKEAELVRAKIYMEQMCRAGANWGKNKGNP